MDNGDSIEVLSSLEILAEKPAASSLFGGCKDQCVPEVDLRVVTPVPSPFQRCMKRRFRLPPDQFLYRSPRVFGGDARLADGICVKLEDYLPADSSGAMGPQVLYP